MLVVNQESLEAGKPQLCQVGEEGEIFGIYSSSAVGRVKLIGPTVRAGGLAEGYLGSHELNEKKFKPNFFTNNEAWVIADEELVRSHGYKETWRNGYKGPRDRGLPSITISVADYAFESLARELSRTYCSKHSLLSANA